jgi:cation transport protein ChaC
VVFQLPADQVQASLDKLLRREMVVKPGSNVPRWLTAETDDGPIRAVGFVVNHQSSHYAARLSPGEVADVLATAAGHVGSGAESLWETVTRLQALGIRDRNLWRLQALVVARIGLENERASRPRHQQDIEELVGN